MGQVPFLEQRAKQEREKAGRSKQRVEQEAQESEASSTMAEARYLLRTSPRRSLTTLILSHKGNFSPQEVPA